MICLNTILNKLSENGYFVYEKCLSGVDLENLNKDFLRITCSPFPECCKSLGLDVGTGVSLTFDDRKHKLLNNTQKFFQQDWMQDISIAFWGKELKINEYIYVMHELPGTVHIAQDLHFDVLKTLKFFLYLNDVSETNGAFSCVPGSHKKSEKIRNKYGNEISYENRHLTRQLDYNKDQVLPIEGNAGDLIIFNTDVWHRAGIVKKGERKVMRGHTRP